MSSVPCSDTQASFAFWPILPPEVKAKIVRKLDLSTALALMRCGVVEKDLVREFGKFKICIGVTHRNGNTLVVYIEEAYPERRVVHGGIQKWEIQQVFEGSMVRILDISNEVIDMKFHKVLMGKMAFSIVGRLLSDKMFEVRHLNLTMRQYEGPVDFSLKKPVDVNHLMLRACSILTAEQILDNGMIRTDSWCVFSFCPTVLEWSRTKLLDIGKKRNMKNMVMEDLSPDVITYCTEES